MVRGQGIEAARASVGPDWSDFLMNRFTVDARPTDPIGKIGPWAE